MKPYSDLTPLTTLLNGKVDVDILRSPFTNIRFGVEVDSIITVGAEYEANLPGLAFDYYGDQSYWRAILAFNGLADPINDVMVGTVLGMPNKSSLDAFMTSNQSAVQQPVLIL